LLLGAPQADDIDRRWWEAGFQQHGEQQHSVQQQMPAVSHFQLM